MALAGLASCKYNTNNYYCPDCNPCGGKDKTETPAVEVQGDAIIIKGDNNDATMIHGNNNNSANRSSGNQNSGVRPVKPVVKPVTPKLEPKPEPKPEPCDCEGGIRITGNFRGTVTVSDGHKTEQSSSNWVYVKTISR